MASQREDPSTVRASNNTRRAGGISARKLAATMWELQEISLSRAALPSKVTDNRSDLHPPGTPGKLSSRPLPFASSPASGHARMRALRRSTVKCRVGDLAKRKPATTNLSPPSTTHTQVLKLLERATSAGCPEDEEDTHEIEIDKGVPTTNIPSYPCNTSATVSNVAATTSSELLKVLGRVWSLEEQHTSNSAVVTSLQSDLDGARSQVKDLTIQQISINREMEAFQRRFADERSDWHEKEQERTNKTVQNLRDELDVEKKSKRKLDLVHRKVNKELIDVKKALMKALQDLEREQKARELMEDVCDELAREVGEDKARVEELKIESIRVREEVEEERKMLQVADVWREERVQMKLAEARLEIEEKNTALDKLRLELDAFLKAKRASSSSLQESAEADSNPEVSKLRMGKNEKQPSANLVSLLKEAYEIRDEQQGSDGDSVDARIKEAIRKLEVLNDSCVDEDEEDEEDEEDIDGEEDEDDDFDQNYIELGRASFSRTINAVPPEKAGFAENLNSQNTSGKLLNAPCAEHVKNQAARQGLLNMNANRPDATVIAGDIKDNGKLWSFDAAPSWSKDTVVGQEKVDRVSNGEKDEANRAEAKDSVSKGDHYFPSATEHDEDGSALDAKCNLKDERLSSSRNEPMVKASLSNTEKGTLQACFEGIATMDVTIKQPCETSSSTIPDMEAPCEGAWSLQNLGSGRDFGASSGLSLATQQQSGSPTRQWNTEMPLPSDPDRLQENMKASKSSWMGGSKPSKEKTMNKGKPGEMKNEARQPRFRVSRV